MLLLRKPTGETIQAFLASQAKLNLTYAAVRGTLTTPPSGYVVDHTRIELGQGEKAFPLQRQPWSVGSSSDSAGRRSAETTRQSRKVRSWRSWLAPLVCGGSMRVASWPRSTKRGQ